MLRGGNFPAGCRGKKFRKHPLLDARNALTPTAPDSGDMFLGLALERLVTPVAAPGNFLAKLQLFTGIVPN